MTLDRFGRHIHHHEAHADEIYLVKDVTDLKTDIFQKLRCASIVNFTLHDPGEKGYLLKFNNTQTFLRLFHSGRIVSLVLEGYKAKGSVFYFLNGKLFTNLEDLYKEKLIPTSCLEVRALIDYPIMGYIILEYSPWFEGADPFEDISRKVKGDAGAIELVNEFLRTST